MNANREQDSKITSSKEENQYKNRCNEIDEHIT